MEYLSEIWVVGRNGYATEEKARNKHPDKEPRLVIYQDKQWPIPHTPEIEAGPYTQPKQEPAESLRAILERCWQSWENKYGDN